MIKASSTIISLAFILGLLSTELPGGRIWPIILGILGAVLFSQLGISPQHKLQSKTRKKLQARHLPPLALPHPYIWLIASLVSLLAGFYLQFRLPQPQNNDISKFIPQDSNAIQAQLVIVRGTIESTPRLTRSQRGQFWLNADQFSEVINNQQPPGISKAVTGKLYVTVPILQSTGLYPGQKVAITGFLYRPKPSKNLNEFNFRRYLWYQGSFSGLNGRLVNILEKERPWGLWKVRQSIVKSHVQFLGIPQGPLVSAMLLGSKAIDLPYDIRDLFIKAGLAHLIAASAFHTSLLLDLVLGLTRKASRRTRLIVGSLILIIFLGLTGFNPSTFRAVLMGLAAFLGIGIKQKIKQLSLFMIVAMILLLINPLWIWDLEFQFSFLTISSLIITVPSINQRLQWLPRVIASLISVPLAATIWTLPIQLSVFGTVPIYSILSNVLSTPLVAIISFGGMLSAIFAFIFPPFGSAGAVVLNCLTSWLIYLVELVGNLPENYLSVGKITIWQLLIVYTLILMVWWLRWWGKHLWFAGLLVLISVTIPIGHSKNDLFRITVLAAEEEPIMVIQDQGNVTVFNSGNCGKGKLTIAPFLQQQGINKIDWAISSNFQYSDTNAWLEIMEKLPIKVFFDYSPTPETALISKAIHQELQKHKGIYQPLSLGQTVSTDSYIAQLVNKEIPILQMKIRGQLWLFIGNRNQSELEKLIKLEKLPRPQVLWHAGQSLKKLLETLKPNLAITVNANLRNEDSLAISKMKTQVFFTEQDGAVQWTADGKLEAFIQNTESRTSIF